MPRAITPQPFSPTPAIKIQPLSPTHPPILMLLHKAIALQQDIKFPFLSSMLKVFSLGINIEHLMYILMQ